MGKLRFLGRLDSGEIKYYSFDGMLKLRNHISQHQYLPKYMIPKTLTAISEIPLTGNDKVDESRLPVPNVHKFCCTT